MGGFKNQLILFDVEVGDRVPAPIPARDHVALKSVHNAYGYPKRSALREARSRVKRDIAYGRDMFSIGLLAGVLLGMILMLTISFAQVV